jgi:hypothetical protein
MSLLRYIVQGIGWQLGSEIAKEGVDEARARQDPAGPQPSERERRRQAKRDERAQEKAAKAAERERKEQEAAREKAKREREAGIERELAELKRKIDREKG